MLLVGLLALSTLGVVAVVGGAAADGSATIRGGAVSSATVTEVTVWGAPGDAADRLTNRSAIRRAQRLGVLNRDTTVVRTDTLVIELRAPGLGERMAAVEGANATERFLGAVYGEDSHLTLRQTDAGGGVEPLAAQFDRSSTMVVPAGTEDEYFLVVEPEKLRVGHCGTACGDDDAAPLRSGAESGRLGDGTAMAMNVTVGANSTTIRRDQAGDPEPILEFVDADAEFLPEGDRGRIRLQSLAAETVRAEVTLARTTPVTVEIVNRTDGGPPIATSTRVVDEFLADVDTGEHPLDNRLVAILNTSGIDPGSRFQLRAVADGTVIERRGGVLRSPTTATETTPSLPTETDTEPLPTDTPSGTPARDPPPETVGSPTTVATTETGDGFGPLAALGALVAGAIALGYLRR